MEINEKERYTDYCNYINRAQQKVYFSAKRLEMTIVGRETLETNRKVKLDGEMMFQNNKQLYKVTLWFLGALLVIGAVVYVYFAKYSAKKDAA